MKTTSHRLTAVAAEHQSSAKYASLGYRATHPGSDHHFRTVRKHRPREIATKKRQRPSGNEIVALLKFAAAGDQRAWDGLVRQFDGIVKATARAHRLSDADIHDVSQETWLKLFEHLDDLREPERVGGWLATTARRESLRVLCGSQRYVLFAPEDAPERECLDALPGDALLMRERDKALRRSLGCLRASDQALLHLLTADPRPTYEDISATLEIATGSIGPTRARALERLRAQLASDGTRTLLTAAAQEAGGIVSNTPPPRVPVLTADRNGEPPLGRARVARGKRRRPYPARHSAAAREQTPVQCGRRPARRHQDDQFDTRSPIHRAELGGRECHRARFLPRAGRNNAHAALGNVSTHSLQDER